MNSHFGDPHSPATALSSPSPSTSNRHHPFPKVLCDIYRVGEELGRGAYGTVFLGLDTRTGEHVAIKALSFEHLSADALSGVASEVELLQNLNHRNIVKYLGSFRTSTHLYIILELMENGSLSNVIKTSKFGPFPESLIPVYVHQVLQGLAYLHAQGVVHRDIKGANILTTKEGVVKLADFGVAAKIGGEIGEAALGGGGGGHNNSTNIDDGESRDVSPQGTPYWMAPEVVEMKPVTTAADIWSVGCLAVELLTGSPPYFDLQPMSALYNIVQDKHPPIPNDISDEMRDFLLNCFQKDPAARPSAEELLQHPWVQYNRRTLRSTWSKATTARKKEELGSIVSVMERLLLDNNGNQQQKQLGEESAPSTPTDKHGADGSSEEEEEEDEDEAMHEELLSTLAADPTGLGLLEHLEGHHLGSDGRGLEGGGVMGGASLLTNNSRPLSGNGNGGPGAGGEGVSQSADMHRRAAAEVRRQLASLQLNVPPGERSIRAEAAAAASCRVLIKYISTDSLLRALFLAEGGVSSLRELLDAPSERLLGASLDLLLVLCAEDTRAAEACCLFGLIPAALRYTAPNYPPDARLSAAQLAALLAKKSKVTCQMLVACQGIPFVMTLLDEGQQTAYELELMQSAMSTLWAILHHSQMKGWSITANAYFRLLGHHGAPYRIAKVLPWVLKNCLAVENNSNSTGGGNGSTSVLQQPWQAATTSGSSNPIGNNLSSGPRHSRSASMPQDSMKGMHPHMNGSQPSPTAVSAGKASVAGTRRSFMSPPSFASKQGGGGKGTAGKDLLAQRSSVSESDAQKQTTANPSSSQMPPLQALFESLLNFFCVMTLGDSSVKQKCAHADTLASIFSLSGMQQPVMLRLLSSIKRLSTDQGAWNGIEKAGGVLYLVAQLPRYTSAVVAAAAAADNTTTTNNNTGDGGRDNTTTTTTTTNNNNNTIPQQQRQQEEVTLGLTEVLSGLQNLCQLSRVRQEQAAVAGAVVYLCTLAKTTPTTTSNNTQVGPPSWQVQAVSILGSLAHGSPRCRAELWAHGGMDTLLQLLQQPPFHLVVLDALSFWLEAEPTRVEPQLLDDTTLDSLANILGRGALQYNYNNRVHQQQQQQQQQQYFLQHGGQERLQGILVAIQRLLNRSQRLAVALASSALPVNILELLKQPSAASALPLLEILKSLYENHPRPKEFILKNRVIGVLGALANGTLSSDQVLVRHQAQNLMDAFQVNMVF